MVLNWFKPQYYSRCASRCVVECRICIREVAGSYLGRTWRHWRGYWYDFRSNSLEVTITGQIMCWRTLRSLVPVQLLLNSVMMY